MLFNDNAPFGYYAGPVKQLDYGTDDYSTYEWYAETWDNGHIVYSYFRTGSGGFQFYEKYYSPDGAITSYADRFTNPYYDRTGRILDEAQYVSEEIVDFNGQYYTFTKTLRGGEATYQTYFEWNGSTSEKIYDFRSESYAYFGSDRDLGSSGTTHDSTNQNGERIVVTRDDIGSVTDIMRYSAEGNILEVQKYALEYGSGYFHNQLVGFIQYNTTYFQGISTTRTYDNGVITSEVVVHPSGATETYDRDIIGHVPACSMSGQ